MDVGLNSVTDQLSILPPLPPPMTDTNHDKVTDSDKEDLSNHDEIAMQPQKSGDGKYIDDSNGDKSSEVSDDVTSHNLNDDGENNDKAFMGKSNYAVDKLCVQQRIMYFLGQSIDQRNRLNVEICLLLGAWLSVSKERTTIATTCNEMMMNRYVNLV